MAKADPLTSAGARLEREAMRKWVHRMMSEYNGTQNAEALKVVIRLAAFLNRRVARYNVRVGGLGKQ